ncbi:23S rRNA methyltransferase [Secundilactobacillus pentosiphilus]|uniref:23S rRNA methyltransferase n=1 Tax=Secundilactobacillus pentosiphilus TaxID=1714682 RepID=A0A1Z5IM10_9LACO|nr:RsmF rRNA methyltransferase first C-terminal domain-containing protein [Secundilactobacillus pentosiphilus]GAX02783.1 23S rRNA methyltransferase [Secundilactobacillus pentosiphilus]
MELPAAFKTKYQRLLGDEATAFFASFDQTENSGFRINPMRPVPADLDLSDPVPYTQWGYYGKVSGRSLDHQSGAVYSQEPSAMFVGEVAHPKAGMRVLDLCASPGGKSTHLGSFLQQSGLLVSNEIMPKRAKVLAENTERFGLSNTLVVNEDPASIAKAFPVFFDQVLVDAPCSGEGMFRKDPDAVSYWSTDYPAACAKRQREILTEAVKVLKPGGELVYSTCTFAPEEDEQIISWLLETYPQFEIVPIEKPAGIIDAKPEWGNGDPSLKGAARLFPHLMRGEGHFVAKLRLNEAIGNSSKYHRQPSNVSRDQSHLFEAFAAEYLNFKVDSHQLLAFGDQLYLMPEGTTSLRGLKVIRPGLHLGTLKKNRFEPSYAMALALSPGQFKYEASISEADWKQVVHGDIFTSDEMPLKKGWVRLFCNHQPVAFGKVVNQTVKNFFPKGLRFKVE